jgi:hypothetical protein
VPEVPVGGPEPVEWEPVAAVLRQGILTGAIPPGLRVSSREVRAAMRALEAEGLLRDHHCGTWHTGTRDPAADARAPADLTDDEAHPAARLIRALRAMPTWTDMGNTQGSANSPNVLRQGPHPGLKVGREPALSEMNSMAEGPCQAVYRQGSWV